MQVWPLPFQFSPWAWNLLTGSSCTNTNTALLPPTSFPSFPLEWFLKYFFGKGKKILLPLSKQKPTCRNPNLPVYLNPRQPAERLLLIRFPQWRRGRQNMFLIAKPNGSAWVLSCLWELVLPQPYLSSPLRQPCQNCVWEWSQGKHEASQGFGESASICQRCHQNWIYLLICYHLLIMDSAANCHKSW